jgi:hypothetical protein
MKKNKDIIEALNRHYDDESPLIPFSAVLYFLLWLGLIAYMIKDSTTHRAPEINQGRITR